MNFNDEYSLYIARVLKCLKNNNIKLLYINDLHLLPSKRVVKYKFDYNKNLN